LKRFGKRLRYDWWFVDVLGKELDVVGGLIHVKARLAADAVHRRSTPDRVSNDGWDCLGEASDITT
jgi:hypothetical protein